LSTRLITVVCAIFAFAYAIAFIKKAHGPDGMVLDQHGRPQLTDYLSLWSAGKLAAEGRPAQAYDWQAHATRMGEAMERTPHSPLQFSYPPSFLLVMAPLSHVPFSASLVLFGLLTLAPFAFLAGRIVGRPEAALWMLATVPPFWNFVVGQTGALAATLLAAGLLLLPARPLLAGAMFGLLAFKPHLGLLVPVALFASGQYRAITAAAATGTAVALVSVVVYGAEPWLAFAASLAKFGTFALADTNGAAYKMQSLFGFLRAFDAPAQIALAAQALLGCAMVALTAWIWRETSIGTGTDDRSHDLKSGILLASTVLVSPYAFHYDLTVLTLAQAFMLRHALATSPHADEIPQAVLVVILAVNALIMIFPPLSIPTGFLASLVLTVALLHRLSQERPGLLPRFASVNPTTHAAS
jgi:hypothetical protein